MYVHPRCKRSIVLQVLYDSRGPDGAGAPLEFDTGVDAVPEAVDMCIRLMTPNELATVTSTPRYAYEGRKDKPLVRSFELQLLSTKSLDCFIPELLCSSFDASI